MQIPVESTSRPHVRPHTREWRWWAIAMILPCCAVLLTVPFATQGFDDDWTYAYTALGYAHSGSIEYKSWSETMMIFQAVYGGLLIRWFGFSFDLLRLATIPFAAGCSALAYLLARRADLPPPVALFAALTATISPLFVPFAASFMTDVYGCFFLLLCLFLGIHAIDSAKQPAAALWLFASIATGVLGGAERQICWVGPIAVLMCFVWRKRKSPSLLLFASLLAMISAAVIWRILLWFARRPIVFIDRPQWGDLLKVPGALPRLTAQYGLSAILFCLPALILLLPSRSNFTPRRWFVALAAAVTWTGIGLRHPGLLAPWLGIVVTPYGIFNSGEELLGDKPIVLGTASRAALTVLVLFMTVVLGQLAIRRLASWGADIRAAVVLMTTRRGSVALLLTLSLLGGGTLTAVRNIRGRVFDDYLLPWLPCFLILLLLLLDRPGLRPRWILGWIGLALFSAYSIAATHDFYATARASAQAAEGLEASGVLPRHIDGSEEFDEWTRLMDGGHICWQNDPAVCQETFDPQYFLAVSPVPDKVSTQFPPVSFRLWLPPFHGQVLTLAKASK